MPPKIMVSPKQLNLSSSGGAGDFDDTFARRKSPRNFSSKRAASDAAEEETKKKKKKKTKEKTKSDSPLFIRIWNEEDELALLKGLVDYKAKSGYNTKIDRDAFYRFLGGSIVAKFSKNQVYSKIRKLRSRFLVHLEKTNEGNDPKSSSYSEAFGLSMMIWGQNQAEFAHDDDGISKEMLKEHEEPINENGAVIITDNGTARVAQQSESGEEMLKEHEEKRVNENEAAKTTESGTNAVKESHDDDDELCAVRDAFKAVMSQGLSDYQKKLQLEKLMNIGTVKRRELSNEWKALCVEEGRLKIMKLRFSVKLAEAANDS